MPAWPFNRSQSKALAQRILDAVVAASRQPCLFGPGRIPDTLDGRFELVTLNAALVLVRLRNEPDGAAVAQHFTDLLFSYFDAGLREAGVGDLTVPKRMHALAGTFYARVDAYGGAIGSPEALSAAIRRGLPDMEIAPELAARAQALHAQQAQAPVVALAEPWPALA